MFDAARVKFGQVVSVDAAHANPDHPVDFFDRERALAQANSLLLDPGCRQPIIILGERRAGKTSLMQLLYRSLTAMPDRGLTPVLIPFQGITNRAHFLRELLYGVRAGFDKLPGVSDSATRLILEQVENTPSSVAEGLRSLLAMTPGRKLILLIDEFDTILDNAGNSAGVSDRNHLLALAHGLVEAYDLNVQLVLTVAHLPAGPAGSRASLLVSSSQIIRLEPFIESDLVGMARSLCGNHTLDNDALEELYDASGGWPYFAKLILHHLAGLEPGDDQIKDAIKSALTNAAADATIADIYDMHFDEYEKALMLLLVASNGHIGARCMEQVRSVRRATAEVLADRGYVRLGKGGGCYLRVGFLVDWFQDWWRYELELEQWQIKEELTELEESCARRDAERAPV